MKRIIEAHIAGRRYLLNTDENLAYVNDLADEVTARIFDIKRDTGASPLTCATMAALMFADDAKKLSADNIKTKKKTS